MTYHVEVLLSSPNCSVKAMYVDGEVFCIISRFYDDSGSLISVTRSYYNGLIDSQLDTEV